MTAERVDQLRALPDQKIPRPEQHGARLLFLALNRDKAHRRSTCSLSDRFRVSRIVLLALDERFDVGRWDQSNLMPEVTDGPPPVVRASTGFQGDDAARLSPAPQLNETPRMRTVSADRGDDHDPKDDGGR